MTKIITISGIDGSGKTTQAKRLEKYIICRGYSCEIYHWLDFPLYNLGSAVLNTEDKTEISNLPKYVIYIKFIISILSMIYYNFLTSYHKKIKKTDYIIFDRCLIDEIVHLNYLGMKLQYLKLLYRFRLLGSNFVIDIDPNIANERDQDYQKGYYIKKHKKYKNLGSDKHHISTKNKDINEIHEEIRNLVK